jgi:hypothetical protein
MTEQSEDSEDSEPLAAKHRILWSGQERCVQSLPEKQAKQRRVE